MHRIVISGYYGFNNIGDESILKAVVENLQERIDDTQITVLSQNPENTREKFGVEAVNRMKPLSIIRTIFHSDLLISGGGSLLQDVTSKRSILYYLAVMWIAILFGKKVFIYSQGIGPVNLRMNRWLMVRTLKRVDYIVVRDEGSKEFLTDCGIDENKITVTADPVIRLKPVGLEEGRRILAEEHFDFQEDREKKTPVIGIAIKGRLKDKDFLEEMCLGIRDLIDTFDARIVLIPFYFSEDMPIAEEIEKRFDGEVTLIRRKCLTDEMLSVIGNMDVLVGIRLHSLIHAAIMGVPMIGISYDPKVNAFMKSMDLRAMCSVYDFKGEYLVEEYEKVCRRKEEMLEKVYRNKEELVNKLNYNEVLIGKLLGEEIISG